MKILIKDKNNSYSIDQGLGICISIPYNYNGDQPNFYNSPQGKSHSMQQDGFIGEISKGKGCKVVNIEQNIHCTGTHTCLLYTSPSPRDLSTSRMPSSA